MGHKVHPMGFRIGVIRDWQAKWYADKHYKEYLQEDLKLRAAVQAMYPEAGVSLVEIDRQANNVSLTIHTARPGIVIGRGGQRVDEMRARLENLVGKRVQLNIREIQQPELDAYLVAKSVAEQIERRIAYRRTMKQAMLRSIQAGAKGMRISCAGRLDGAEIARRVTMHEGQVPLHTLRADIDYGFIEARTTMGRVGVKVWLYKGDILPTPKVEEVEEIPAELEAEVKPSLEAKVEEIEAPIVEPVAEVSTEVKPTVEPEEKPAEPPVRRRTRAKSSAEVKVEEAAAEPATEVSAEAKPTVEPEEKPAEPTVRRRTRVKPSPGAKVEEAAAEPAAEVSAEITPVVEPEEKPAKPAVKRRTRAKPSPEAKVEEAAAEPVADKGTEAGLAENEGEDSATT